MKKLNLTAFIAFVICAAFAFNTSVALAKDMTKQDFEKEALEHITTISVAEAKALLDKGGVTFLDVRTEKEFRAGHIPGAKNVPRGKLEYDIGKFVPDTNTPTVVYCKTGGRSCLGTYTLVKMGYKNLKSMDGGWLAWVKEGYPVE
jgi:rhodanese-related sulfurtransferase